MLYFVQESLSSLDWFQGQRPGLRVVLSDAVGLDAFIALCLFHALAFGGG